MAYGVQVSTTNGQRIIDGSFMLPEFIGKAYLDPTPVFNAQVGDAVYYTKRWDFAANQSVLNDPRQKIIFWKYPDTGSADLWWTAYNYGAMNMYYMAGVSTPTLPVAYVFAVGNSTYGGASYGMRVWNESGTLIFDSANGQLVVTNVASGLQYAVDMVQTTAVSMPSSAAFLQPTCYHIFDQRTPYNDEYGYPSTFDFILRQGALRRNGGYIQTYLPIVEEHHSVGGTSYEDWNENAYFGSTTGLDMPIIDTSIYDY